MAERLRQEILNGIYRAGKRLPGEPMLARRFGVGRTTVAKALAILQQSNLVFRLRSSGTYVQHDAARGTVSLSIGYFVNDIAALRSTPAGICLEAAHQYLEERGHAVRLLTRNEFFGGGGPAATIRRMVRSGAMNGLIISDPLSVDLLANIGRMLPTVYGRDDMAPETVLNVAVDFTLGYFLAARHLLELGHRKIGMLGGSPISSIGYRGYQAFRLALQLAGIDPQTCPITSRGYKPAHYRPQIDQMLQAHPDLTGVICADDMAAVAAVEAAQASGRPVPERFSVVGCNDVPSDALLRPLLTTLRIDFAALGQRLAEVVLARIYGRECAGRWYLEPELIVRGSTGPPPRG